MFFRDLFIFNVSSSFVALLSIFQAWWIPSLLPLKEFGYWKLFRLYGGFVDIVALGFVGGLLLRWAGKEWSEVRPEIGFYFRRLILHLVLVLGVLGFAFYMLFPKISSSWILWSILVYAFIHNIISFFTKLLSATKRFNSLSWGRPVMMTFFIASLVFISAQFLRSAKAIVVLFILCSVIQMLVLVGFSIIHANGHPSTSPTKSLESWATLTRRGIYLLLVFLIFPFVIRLDQILLSFFYPIGVFATYSFATGVLTPFWIFSYSISEVFFPHVSSLSPTKRQQVHRLTRPLSGVGLGLFLGVYFLIDFLVRLLLPRYDVSLPIVRILIGSVGFMGIILIFHYAFYKCANKQRVYFINMVATLGLIGIGVQSIIFLKGPLWGVALTVLCVSALCYVVSDRILLGIFNHHSKKSWVSSLRPLMYLAGFWGVLWVGLPLNHQALWYGLFLAGCIWVELKLTKSMRFNFIQE